MKLSFDDIMQICANNPYLAKVLDLPLQKSHRLYHSQQFFVDYAKAFAKYGVEISTHAMHNDENTVSFHFPKDRFVLACILDHKTPYIEISKIKDEEKLIFDVIEEIPYSLEVLTLKLKEYALKV